MHQQFFGQPFPSQNVWGNQPFQQPGINVAEIVNVLSRIAPLLQSQSNPFQPSPFSQFGQQTPFVSPHVLSTLLGQLTPYLQTPFMQGQFGQTPSIPQNVIGSVLGQSSPYLPFQQQGIYGQQTPFPQQQGVYEIVNAIARILPVLQQQTQQPWGTGVTPGAFSGPFAH